MGEWSCVISPARMNREGLGEGPFRLKLKGLEARPMKNWENKCTRNVLTVA